MSSEPLDLPPPTYEEAITSGGEVATATTTDTTAYPPEKSAQTTNINAAEGTVTAAELAGVRETSTIKTLDDHERALHLAVKNKHEAIAKRLLHAGVNVNCDDSGWSPLQKAVSYHLEKAGKMIKILIDYGADVHACNKEGMTALCVAARKGVHTASEILHKEGSELNPKVTQKVQWSPFLLAAWGGDLKLMKKYISWGADIHAVNHEGWNALHVACRQGNIDIVYFLLTGNNPISIHSRVDDQRTALHIAARFQHLDIARCLIDMGADVDAPDQFLFTPLLRAVQQYSLEMVKLLVDSGADVNVSEREGWTPLSLSIHHRNEPVALYLLNETNANIESHDIWEYTPFLWSVRCRMKDVTRKLIDRGANVNAKTNTQETAVHLATFHKSVGMLEMLLELNTIDVNAANYDGWQALRSALRIGDSKAVRLLLDHGAESNTLDSFTQTDNKDLGNLSMDVAQT